MAVWIFFIVAAFTDMTLSPLELSHKVLVYGRSGQHVGTLLPISNGLKNQRVSSGLKPKGTGLPYP